MRKLAEDDLRLLMEAVCRHAPGLAGVVDLVGKTTLTDKQREELREALADELFATGLKPDGEPSERGIRLDDIIGALMFY